MTSVYCVFIIHRTNKSHDEWFKGVFSTIESATKFCDKFNGELEEMGQGYMPILQTTRYNASNLIREGKIFVIEECVPV